VDDLDPGRLEPRSGSLIVRSFREGGGLATGCPFS
jgi:hypothetical protein